VGWPRGLHTTDGTDLVLTTDDYVEMFQRIAAALAIPIREVNLRRVHLALRAGGVPEIAL
jgi:hypothetical protein